MMYNDYWTPVTGNIDQAGQYSLFGFDAGWGDADDQGTVITITTNLNTYTFTVDFDRADNPKFYGFVSDAGEYFTAFNINSIYYSALNGIDNVTLGQVPEPSTMPYSALVCLAFGD
jgi:hypothetical protein